MDEEIKFFFSVSELKNYKILDGSMIVSNMLKGNKVSLIVGGMKMGKSTLALDMAQSVSLGKDFLGRKTTQMDVLYISLDNDPDLIAERIKLMGMDDNDHLDFYFKKEILLYSENVNQLTLTDIISDSKKKHPNLGLVFIDLLNDIRSLNYKTENSNVKVAEDIEVLKGLAELYSVAIVALHQDRKDGSDKGYAGARGGGDLVGSINGSYMHLVRSGIGTTSAVLEIGGRNIPEDVINIELDTKKLKYHIAETASEEMEYEVGIIRNFLLRKGGFEGTLMELLKDTSLTCSSVRLGKLLNKRKDILESEGIHFKQLPGRKNGRVYSFEVDRWTEEDGHAETVLLSSEE